MQDGYASLPEPEALHEVGQDMPLRALSPGLHMGLSVVMDVQEEEYYCTGHESVGFKASELLFRPRGLKASLKVLRFSCLNVLETIPR